MLLLRPAVQVSSWFRLLWSVVSLALVFWIPGHDMVPIMEQQGDIPVVRVMMTFESPQQKTDFVTTTLPTLEAWDVVEFQRIDLAMAMTLPQSQLEVLLEEYHHSFQQVYIDDTQHLIEGNNDYRHSWSTSTTSTTTTTENNTIRRRRRRKLAESTPYGIPLVLQDSNNDNIIPMPPPPASWDDCFKVCVVDSGCLLDHPDLPFDRNNTATTMGQSFGLGPTAKWYQPSPSDGHGTHVTGTIFAQGDNDLGVRGIIDNPQGFCLLVAQVFGEAGFQDASVILQGIEWCADNGAKVINMSFGGSMVDDVAKEFYKTLDEDDGILLVAAAGNAGTTEKLYPASYPSVVSVGALNETSMERASFSQTNDEVDLVAPGIHINSTSGTGVVSIQVVQMPKTTTGVEEEEQEEGVASQQQATSFQGIFMTFSPPVQGNDMNANEGDWNDLELVDCGLAFDICDDALGKVCLIERGETLFIEKAIHCSLGGGIAALIYNNEPLGFLGSLGYEALILEGVFTIPVLAMTREDGLQLLQYITTTDEEEIIVDETEGQESDNVLVSLIPKTVGYMEFDGTSMATPHVTGVAAKIWAARPECTNQQIKQALFETSLDLGDQGRDDDHGHGLVQAWDAYQFLLGLEEPCGEAPSASPTQAPTMAPTSNPTSQPSSQPTTGPPTSAPSQSLLDNGNDPAASFNGILGVESSSSSSHTSSLSCSTMIPAALLLFWACRRL